ADRLEEAGDAGAGVVRKTGGGKGEQDDEDDQRQDRIARGGGDRIGRDDALDEIGEAGRLADRRGRAERVAKRRRGLFGERKQIEEERSEQGRDDGGESEQGED